MDNFIYAKSLTPKLGETMVKKVLIATLYSAEPVILATTRLGPHRLILLIDKTPDAQQTKSLATIQNSLGKVLDVKAIKTDVYDIVAVAKKCVDIIDAQPSEDIIYVNITSGRKTKAIGLLFAAYARHDKVKKITYNIEEDKGSVISLPRLSFKLSESQKLILNHIGEKQFKSISDLAEQVDISKAMLYRALDELKDMDLVSTYDGIVLTDAGRIARL